MTPDEAAKDLAAVQADLERIDQAQPDDWPIDDALVVWEILDRVCQLARMVLYRHGCVLAARLPDEYDHHEIGKVHTQVESKVKWDGAAVLNALSQPMVNQETGEKDVPAVRLDILRKVLPAVQPGNTSSRWNKSGLTAAGIQPGMYSETEWGSKVLRRGPKYRR